MDSPLTLTPRRGLDFDDDEVKHLLTPEVRKDLRQLFEDEDSGLGMDYDKPNEEPEASFELPLLDFAGALTFMDTIEKIKKRTLHQSSTTKRSLFHCKREREQDDENGGTPLSKSRRRGVGVFRKSKSVSFGMLPVTSPLTRADDVKTAVNRLVEEEDLVGDGTDTFCLPTMRGKHQDLKSISSDTMTDVLSGKYDDDIGKYRIIDCRYPYEYNGGHIMDAENRYTRDQVQQLLQEGTRFGGKRNILIFHCEFSSERGPKMMRFLRTQDRAQNEANYPSLTYPEVYLLDGGYKPFYQTHKTLCHPMEYTPMLHQSHSEDLRHFRSKSKSWCVGDKKKSISRLRL